MRLIERFSRLAPSVIALYGLMWTGMTFAATSANPVITDSGTENSQSKGTMQLQEVTVTARRFKEDLQKVPVSFVSFTPTTIRQAGIQTFSDLATLVPSLNFESSCAFECGQSALISMRGVGNGQQGWPSIAYIVDGVPATSLNDIDAGSLNDIESVQVLRGPQSALYGFNAIAGAVIITTRRPTNHWQGDARMLYGNGNDRQVGGDVSGPIIPSKLLVRLSASYRDNTGLFRSASNGIPLSFQLWKQVGLQVIWMPTSNLTVDLQGNMDREHDGAVYEEKVPSAAYATDFSAPYTNPRRAFPGVEDRSIDSWSAHVKWDFGPMSLISVTAFNHTDENVPNSSLCYDDPNDPIVPAPGGGAGCLFGPAYGSAAAPGQAIDNFYSDLNHYRSIYEDLRLASQGAGPLEWTVGFTKLYRRAVEGFDAGVIQAPIVTPGNITLVSLQPQFLNLFPSWHRNFDNWWGVYGEVIWNATQRLQFTAAARYDDERYSSISYTSRAMTTPVSFATAAGPELTQRDSGESFQPSGTVSYHFTDKVMAYTTVSRGFRAGYFFNGNYTLPEHTTNYEVGVKSTIANRIRLNADVFHIKYSQQQFSFIISHFPFQESTTIPLTRINGVELDSTVIVSRFVKVGLGLSYLNAEVSDHTASPNTPKLQVVPNLDLNYPFGGDWSVFAHLDDRYNSGEYLSTSDQQYQGPTNLLNVRLGVEDDRYSVAGFVSNAANRRFQPTAGTVLGAGWIRYMNEPRTYGVEVRARFY